MDAQLGFHLDATRPSLSWESLDSEELAVARVLRWGRARAIQIPELAAAADLPPRRTQEVVQRLILRHHWPIGTAMAAPFGNYLIDSAAELEETIKLLRERGISSLVRAAALNRSSLQEYLAHLQYQLTFATDDEVPDAA